MKRWKAIAAMSLNRVIGRGNAIPWHLPEDLKWFKRMTAGQIVVMGRRTFESIGKLLANRTILVLTRRCESIPGVRIIRDLREIEEWAKGGRGEGRESETERREVFICGGGQVYAQALPLCSDLYLTLVKRTVEGDVFFPPFEDQFEFAEEIMDCPEFRIVRYRRNDE